MPTSCLIATLFSLKQAKRFKSVFKLQIETCQSNVTVTDFLHRGLAQRCCVRVDARSVSSSSFTKAVSYRAGVDKRHVSFSLKWHDLHCLWRMKTDNLIFLSALVRSGWSNATNACWSMRCKRWTSELQTLKRRWLTVIFFVTSFNFDTSFWSATLL